MSTPLSTTDDDQIVYIDNKAYRKGYTTGSCATAAAKVAAQMILSQQLIHHVTITTPSRVQLHLEVLHPCLNGQRATAAIQKDGGDDIDVTHGMLIFATVTLTNRQLITIDGGKGIGRITRQGLRRVSGSAAINPTPLRMIEQAVRDVIGPNYGADVVIFAPEGEARAKQTYNPRLGIEGGISILGTSGIVTPMSDDSWKKAISLEIEDKVQQGLTKLIFVPGNYGEKFAHALGCDPRYVVVMGNYVRHVLKEAERFQIQRVLLLGHIGKLIKVAAGILNTHSHIADGRMETLICHLALLGAPQTLLQRIDQCNTTEAAIELINQAGYQAVYDQLCQRIKQRTEQLSHYTTFPLQIDSVLCTLDGHILASSQPFALLKKEFSS